MYIYMYVCITSIYPIYLKHIYQSILSRDICLSAIFYISFLIITSSKHRICSMEMFYEICVLKNNAKFKGKPLCRSLFLNKFLVRRRPATLLRPWFRYRSFSVDFAIFLKTPILQNICKQLLLKMETLRVTKRSDVYQKFDFFLQKSLVFGKNKYLPQKKKKKERKNHLIFVHYIKLKSFS